VSAVGGSGEPAPPDTAGEVSPRAAAAPPVERCDVAIVGGGMVGAALALALRDTPLRIALVEGFAPGSAAQPSFDDRTSALGNGTRRTFEALGIWERVAPEAGVIRQIHVSDAGRFGFARLVAAEQGVEAFGYVVPNRAIGTALWEALASAPHVLPLMPARATFRERTPDAVRLDIRQQDRDFVLEARLLVAADGAQSGIRDALGIGSRVEDYDQTAVVTNVATSRSNDGTAYERFTPTGPLAVLPLAGGGYTVVWTLRPARAEEVLRLDDAAFVRELQQCFGWRIGRIERIARRNPYPLALTRAEATVAPRAVLIGNASQALHPVAGQGFNLGLRDAATLAEVLAEIPTEIPAAGSASPVDPGADHVLRRFEQLRERDRRGVTRFTDGLVKLFADTRPGFGVARDLGLLLFDLTPAAKSALSRLSWGFAGRQPRLARGLPLR